MPAAVLPTSGFAGIPCRLWNPGAAVPVRHARSGSRSQRGTGSAGVALLRATATVGHPLRTYVLHRANPVRADHSGIRHSWLQPDHQPYRRSRQRYRPPRALDSAAKRAPAQIPDLRTITRGFSSPPPCRGGPRGRRVRRSRMASGQRPARCPRRAESPPLTLTPSRRADQPRRHICLPETDPPQTTGGVTTKRRVRAIRGPGRRSNTPMRSPHAVVGPVPTRITTGYRRPDNSR